MSIAEPTAQPAMAELLDLARATRPDIDRNDLQGAILGAEAAGRTWPQVLVLVAQMLARGETPYDLRNAARPQPWERPRRDYDHHA